MHHSNTEHDNQTSTKENNYYLSNCKLVKCLFVQDLSHGRQSGVIFPLSLRVSIYIKTNVGACLEWQCSGRDHREVEKKSTSKLSSRNWRISHMMMYDMSNTKATRPITSRFWNRLSNRTPKEACWLDMIRNSLNNKGRHKGTGLHGHLLFI